VCGSPHSYIFFSHTAVEELAAVMANALCEFHTAIEQLSPVAECSKRPILVGASNRGAHSVASSSVCASPSHTSSDRDQLMALDSGRLVADQEFVHGEESLQGDTATVTSTTTVTMATASSMTTTTTTTTITTI
jgi:hypothetical protein